MSNNRKYTLNENCFDELTPESAYWIGFIIADGCIMQRNKYTYLTRICLANIDKDHILKYQKFIGSNHPLYIDKNNKNAVYSDISSKKLFYSLKKWGVEERKTYSKLSFISKIPDEFKPYFICGIFDGDGSFIVRNKRVKDKRYNRIYNYEQCTISLLSNKSTLEDICSYLQTIGMRYPKITKATKQCRIVYNCRWYSKKDIDIFYSIYKSSPITLDRKMEKITNFLSKKKHFIDKRQFNNKK